MKNLSKVLALVLVVAMVFSFAVSAGATTSYKDDASINYQEAVQLLSALDVLNGYEDGSFKPGANITRAEVATMVSYLVANSNSETPLYSDIYKLNADYKALCTFADSKASWAAGFIAFCAGNGYISGRDANTFDPDATITLAECSVILLRVMGYNAKNEAFGTTANTVNGYNTQLCARNAGLLTGLENSNFFAAATREQVAQLFLNALKGNVVSYGYNNYSLVVSNGDQNYNITLGGKAIVGEKQLVNYCFKNVKIDDEAVNEYGLKGHQWYSEVGLKKVALTDIFVDDETVATFPGATTYAKIASDLGITKNSTRYDAEMYVNGVQQKGHYALNDFYGQTGALEDYKTLIVIKNYERGMGNPTYKLMYYTEYLAVAANKGVITTPATSLHLGEYLWEFSVYNRRQDTKIKKLYMYGDKDTYTDKGYYLIVPRDVRVGQYLNNTEATANYEYVVELDSMLSIKAAEFSDAVKVTAADNADLKNLAKKFYVNGDNTKAYDVSAVYNNFDADFGFGKSVKFIYNSVGYVIGTVDASTSDVDSTGYVYLDSFEYAVTASGYSYLIDAKDYTWAAQAKANVYFPTAEGATTPTVIDIQINKAAKLASFDANNNVDTEKWSDAGLLKLSTQSTPAFWDKSTVSKLGQTVVNGNVRVYDEKFDGWYEYTKYTDGTYALEPVEKDYFTAAKGTYKYSTGYSYAGAGTTAWLNDKTVSTVYTMDLRTMTAKSVATVGYKSIDGKLGYWENSTVGGEVTEKGGYVTAIDTFKVTNSTTIKYALYIGTGLETAKGHNYKFFVDGEIKEYTNASTATFDGNVKSCWELVLDVTGTKINTATKLLDKTDFEDCDWYTVTYANDAYVILTKGTETSDIKIDTAQVWNYKTGAAATLAKGDKIVYAPKDATTTALVVYVQPYAESITDPYAPHIWWH